MSRRPLLALALSLTLLFAVPTAAQAPEPPSAVFIQSVGVPPPGLVEYVASVGRARDVQLRWGSSIASDLADWCGYTSRELIERTQSLNGATITALGGMDVKFNGLNEKPSIRLPACIVARANKAAEVRLGEGFAALLKRELGLDYVSDDPGFWQPYVQQLCSINQKSVTCKLGSTPILPIGKVRLPYGLSRSYFEIENPTENPISTVIARIEGEAKKVTPPVRDATIRPLYFAGRAIAIPKIGNLPPYPCNGSPGDPPYDIERLQRLAGVYASAIGRKIDPSYTQGRVSVVTIVDTGVLPDNDVLDKLLYRKSNVHDSSNADALAYRTNESDGYPSSEYQTLEKAQILDPVRVLNSHGTHVAGLAMGSATSALPTVSGDDYFPRMRVFRVLSGNAASKYDLTFPGFMNGIEFVKDRTSGPTYDIINFSFALPGTDADSAERNILQIANSALVIAAAGNDGKPLESNQKIPARFGGQQSETAPFVVTVGALGTSGDRWPESNYSKNLVDVFAPGECQSSFDGIASEFVALSGTSQAAPWVAFTAALLYQMPLPGKHPSRIKNRIVSSVESRASLSDVSESGGVLDPMRTIDVAVDHITLRAAAADGSKGDRAGKVRALIDYSQSEQLCAEVKGANHVSRFEVRDGKARYRLKVTLKGKGDQPLPGKPARGTPWQDCTAMSPKMKIRYFADTDFGRLASGEKVPLREIEVGDLVELVPRVFEQVGDTTDVSKMPRLMFWGDILRDTTAVVLE